MKLKRDSRFFIAACAAAALAACPALAGPGDGAITALSVAKLAGTFVLTQASSTKVSDFVTTAKYTATGVTITVDSTTLTGDLAISTTTTADTSGNGVVDGDLVFTATDKTVLSAHLEGLVGTVTAPVLVEGTIGQPPTAPTKGSTTTTAPAAPATVAAYLATDSSLNATLTGYVATATVSAPTKPTGGSKPKPKGK